MGAICNILGSRISRRDTGFANPGQWLIDLIGGSETASGVKVTEQSAMKHTPFWSAVRVISGTLAALPFIAYRRQENGGKDRLPSHPVYNLLHNRPNEYMDAVTFIETRQAHVLTYGNGYAEIQRNGAGRPIALWPLMPNMTTRKIKDGVIYYEVSTQAGETVYLPDYNVLHIKGLGFDGYTGYNVVQYHREAIGYGKAVKEYGSRFFGSGANAGGTFEHPGQLTDKAKKHLDESLKSFKGLSQAYRIMILEEGMKFNKTSVDPEQAQALETQKYTVDDCARIFNIPPHKLASLDRATFSNIEEQNIDFISQTMLYWFKKWESECNYKLFTPAEQKNMFCEILFEGLLRGNTQQRYMAYNVGRNAGFLCVDDIRDKENMNPLPDGKGKIFLQPLNMVPAGSTPPAPKQAEPIDDDIRTAHRDLIASQWSRIITKQINAVGKGTNGDFYDRQRQYASTILIEPVKAFASLIRKQNEVREILYQMIQEHINLDTKLEFGDADKLAAETMSRIGGDYAVAETK